MTEEPLNLDPEEAVDRLTGALIGNNESTDDQIAEENSSDNLTDAELDDLQTCLVLTLSDAARANLHGAIDTIRTLQSKSVNIRRNTPHGWSAR